MSSMQTVAVRSAIKTASAAIAAALKAAALDIEVGRPDPGMHRGGGTTITLHGVAAGTRRSGPTLDVLVRGIRAPHQGHHADADTTWAAVEIIVGARPFGAPLRRLRWRGDDIDALPVAEITTMAAEALHRAEEAAVADVAATGRKHRLETIAAGITADVPAPLRSAVRVEPSAYASDDTFDLTLRHLDEATIRRVLAALRA